ncbi:CD27 antigen isoform X2 [Sander lucioperca]|uniref:CD27 antigen isoform X2 n=1 Tax=Sander lucioperca TaxID=283035 RepID=UPI00125DC0E2|nr:CD27 antigen isoform X2 [Sander lucioperca]
MQPLCFFAFTFLVSLSFLSAVLSIDCNEREYEWPVEQPNLCCGKCPPGKHVVRRSETTCEIECESCTKELFNEKYNVKMACDYCENCDKPNMEYISHCNVTHNAVCRCKDGYRCTDQSCKQCVPIPSFTTKPTLPPSTTALKSGAYHTGIALIVVIKIKPFLHWIKAKHSYLLAKEPVPVPPFSEDEEVSKPVQEVRGKCDV